jgi:hypothetical protein
MTTAVPTIINVAVELLLADGVALKFLLFGSTILLSKQGPSCSKGDSVIRVEWFCPDLNRPRLRPALQRRAFIVAGRTNQ